ncbi:hypothetical protein BBP40_010654 [Aspergillus hancockii]|nr:hypothetical protein BBP40_010654 [Aspergillus hancockii]
MACNGLEQIHEAYFSWLQIGIATWLLQREVGVACVAPIIVAAACAVVTYKVSYFREDATKSMLSNMRTVKMSSFANSLFSRIYNLRNDELNSALKYRTLLVWSIVLAYAPSAISPIVTPAIYGVIQSNMWNASTASSVYTAISSIGLIHAPPPLLQSSNRYLRL